MYVWSKKIAVGLLGAFIVLLILFFIEGPLGDDQSVLKAHTTRWIALNYAGLVIWLFVWMLDQANIRGQQKNVWLWLLPFLFAPLPTLMGYILFLQRRT